MIAIAVREESQVAEARRQAADEAARQGFSTTDTGRVALVATELATNLIKHGSGGEILIGTYAEARGGIELLALDQGRGMADVDACMEDGYSSSGTAGHGLGAVRRQSDVFEIASWPGIGTAVLCRLSAGRTDTPQTQDSFPWGAVSIAKAGESVCGDSWSISNFDSRPTLLIADGLGHGPEAAEAAVEAVRIFQRHSGHSVVNLLEYIHGGLRSTRGAAVSIVRLDQPNGKLGFAGIGNVAGLYLANGELRRMVSMSGTAGYTARRIQSFDYPFTTGLVMLHSDGLGSNVSFDRYKGLDAHHPALIAGVLYRDFNRNRDDATVLVAKW